MTVTPEFIPVLRPRLPSADLIVEYLRRIDASRIYSNFGPLTLEFGFKLAHHFGVAPESVVCTSSGTSALIGAVLAIAGVAKPSRPLALLPAFTFVATGIAAERCGFQPYLVDVTPTAWTLNPETLLDHPALERVGVVIPVAPFGRPLVQADWISFRERTRIPVIIDAAAAFACISRDPRAFLRPIPIVLSFHATKSFGIGEGGCVISTEAGVIDRVAAALNYGFLGTRESITPSINGKLSEYHAAVGLAELDCWPAKNAAFENITRTYRSRFLSIGLGDRFFGLPDVDGSYALYMCASNAEATSIGVHLKAGNVDFRHWYGDGLHRQRHFFNASRDDLPVTELLGQRLIGLPIAPDLPHTAIERVVEAIGEAVFADSVKR